jgi:N-acetylglucosaminyldiphosphoundecaprenol N-acetyl-beta-D-mannosaminyltransferase
MSAPALGRAGLEILGCRVDRVDAAGAAARIADLIEQRRPAHVVTLGAEMANLAYDGASYRDVINAADLVVPDTVGIVAASRLLGSPLHERVAGIDLLERLCADAAVAGHRVYLLGGVDGVAAEAGRVLEQRHPGLKIAGAEHGYFADSDASSIAQRIHSSGARLALIGLGFPRQEFFIHENLAFFGPAVCVGVGGSFDVIAGRLPRAPRLIRAAGLEWLYRLAREPHRFRRQLALPLFAARVLRQSLGLRVGASSARVK